jgi:hypothetical protein
MYIHEEANNFTNMLVQVWWTDNFSSEYISSNSVIL